MLKYKHISLYIAEAIKRLFERDSLLFEASVHEICINHRLAIYLEQLIPDFFYPYTEDLSVDIEFNRTPIDTHTMSQMKIVFESDMEPKQIRPDIILHHRGDPLSKVLWLEVKIGSDPYICTKDIHKANFCCNYFKYEFAASILINHPQRRVRLWVMNGSKPIEEYEYGYENGVMLPYYECTNAEIEPYPLLIMTDKNGKDRIAVF